MVDDVQSLVSLGSSKTNYKFFDVDPSVLEVFDNGFSEADYEVVLNFPEFTSLCPKTGQPDFARIEIVYSPKDKCVETKSLKLYLFSWRNKGSFMETIVNTIFEDIKKILNPRKLKVSGFFNPRGGIALTVNRVFCE